MRERSAIHFASASSALLQAKAFVAEPLIIGECSPSYLYLVKSSLISASTRSKSSFPLSYNFFLFLLPLSAGRITFSRAVNSGSK